MAGRNSVPELLRGVSHNLRGGHPTVYMISDFISIHPCYIFDACCVWFVKININLLKYYE